MADRPAVPPSPSAWPDTAACPSLCAELPDGDRVRVALHGAQVLSWVAAGRERLYLSPDARLDGASPIRGGVPVCFPQFNQRGPLADRLPKHGFVRNWPWVPVTAGEAPAPSLLLPDGVQATQVRHLSLQLRDDEATRALWPPAFHARLTVSLWSGGLQVTLALHNPGSEPWAFSGALHTYLAVNDIDRVALLGLAGQAEWDALSDRHGRALSPLPLACDHRGPDDRGFDRVYARPDTPLWLDEGDQRLQIDSSATWPEVVVWNPGVVHSAALADLPDDAWRHMLCVEAARVHQPQVLAPGDTWQGWQRFTLAAAPFSPVAAA